MKQFLICLLLSLSFTVYSQTPPAPDSLIIQPAQKASSGFSKKPDFRLPERNILLKSAAVLAGTGTMGLATYFYGDEPLQQFSQKIRNQTTNSLTTYLEPMGRSRYLMPAAGVVYLGGLALRNKNLQRTGILAATSLTLNNFVTGKLKDEFQRHRPDVSLENDAFDGGEGGRHHASMPSSHTSTAFAFATSVATIYKRHKWVPPLAYGTATLVGLSRIHDNKHWATDVLAGAAVGFLSTKAAYLLMRQTEKLLEKKRINIYLAPQLQQNGAGISAGVSF